MQVAMMTLNVYDNYGNMLQKYALYHTLKKFADSVDVLWHPCTKPFFPYELEINRHSNGNLIDAAFKSVMAHATLICTHSFHATAFATIFKRPFIIYRTGSNNVLSRFSRLESLLELFGLENRLTDLDLKIKVDDPLKINFTRCEEVLPLEKTKALRFLANALLQ